MKNTSGVDWSGSFVSMCCKPNELYSPDRSMCYRNGSFTDENLIFPGIHDADLSISPMRPSDFYRLYEFSCNGSTYDLESYPPKNLLDLLTDFRWIYFIRSIDDGFTHWLAPDDCFESKITENGTRIVATVCETKLYRHEGETGLRNLISLIGLAISLPFLAATFLVYSILPELRNLPGSIFRCFLVSVFVFYAGTAVNMGGVNPVCSYFLVVFQHFVVMATFFWLQVMCFDIWWTFRQFRSVQHNTNMDNRKKFIIYSIYAWGCSALIPAVAVIIDSFPILPKGIISPEISRYGSCGFTTNKAAIAVYIYAPLIVTVISNACFIVLTAIRIMRHEKDTSRRFNEGDNQRHNDQKESFYLYLKLFVVMGISWIVDLFVWLMGDDLSDNVGCILDLPNSLQGFFLFLIFVCKPNVKRMLLKRLGCKDRTEAGKENQRTSSQLALEMAEGTS